MRDPLDIGSAWRRAGDIGPPVDVYETEATIIVRLAVPGAEGASLTLTLEEAILSVRGESAPPGPRWSDRTVVHWQEIPYGRFDRRIQLPVSVDRDGVKAAFRNGILEITLPKRSAKTARTVKIESREPPRGPRRQPRRGRSFGMLVGLSVAPPAPRG